LRNGASNTKGIEMNKTLGALVAVVVVAGLGYWGARTYAVTMENKITKAASVVIADAEHLMEVTVSGRDIILSGTADTQAEFERLVAGLEAIRGRRVVNADRVIVLPDITPYETALAKGGDGTIVATGNAPSRAVRDALAQSLPAVALLPLGHGAPDGWRRALLAGKAALAPLDEGSAALTGKTLAVAGLAATQLEEVTARGALAQLEGFDTLVSIDVRDPGIVAFTLRYNADDGLAAKGTLPGSLGAGGLAKALGGASVAGEPGATFAEVPGLANALKGFAGELGTLETATFTATNDGMSLEAQALAGLDAETVRARLAAAMGVAVAIGAAPLPEDGAERINAATGARQVAFGGTWLTMPEFEPTKSACTEAAMATVDASPILFTPGSAALDPASIATINDVAGIVRLCTRDAGMRVIVGAHTDAQGDDTANYSLSVARARAVRGALVLRGITAEKLTATGYGETEPVAANETEEGRAKNRRITFAWPE